MLDQLIFTDCYPHRDLLNNGQVSFKEGQGVFSISESLFSSDCKLDCKFLNSRIYNLNAASDDIGLFNSYEYIMISPDTYVLSFDMARPLCNDFRPDGKSNRSGTHIKQSFVGGIEGYPVEWFGSDVWDAHKKSQNDYYLKAEPPFLPQVSGKLQNGYINPKKVKEFVNDGRIEAVKAGLWFLIQQFNKNEDERKILLIKDTPENVELWISAIEYGFSTVVAQKITFTTNISRLESYANLFYFVDDFGDWCEKEDKKNHQTRHPYYMIAGFHPKQDFKTYLVGESNYVIIDGILKTTNIQPDDSVKKAYYSAVVEYDGYIEKFCRKILALFPDSEKTVNYLPELFDACGYLFNEDHHNEKWGYQETLENLNVFLKFGMPNNNQPINYIICEIKKAYSRFAREDEKQGFPLLKIMINCAEVIDCKNEIIDLIADVLKGRLNNLGKQDNLSETWTVLNSAELINDFQPVLLNVFIDTRLFDYCQQFKDCDENTIKTVLEMFFQMLESEKNGFYSILQNNSKYQFLGYAIVALLNQDAFDLLGWVLKKINSESNLFNKICDKIIEHIEKKYPDKKRLFWNTLLKMDCENVSKVCNRLSSPPSVNIDIIEDILSYYIEKNQRFDDESLKTFEKIIKKSNKNSDTGLRFFTKCIELSETNEFGIIFECIRSCKLNVFVQEKLFSTIDKKLLNVIYGKMSVIDLEQYEELFREINFWKHGLFSKIYSVSEELYYFKRMLEKRQKNAEVEKAIRLVYGLSDMEFMFTNDFFSSDYFKEITAISAKFHNAEMHISMLFLLSTKSAPAIDYYVDKYLDEVLSEKKSYDLFAHLVSLWEATKLGLSEFIVPNLTIDEVKKIQYGLNTSLTQKISEYSVASIKEFISQCKKLSYEKNAPTCIGELKTLLENANDMNKSCPKKCSSFVNRIFNSYKKQ